jgi:nucleotide-binding universal stress UspA family protein
VVEDWDWHLKKDGSKKRHLHWCVVVEIRKGLPPDAFPSKEGAKWKKWAKEAFNNWTKDSKKKPTGWTFEEVSMHDKKCQVMLRFSKRPNASYGTAYVPSGEKGDQRAKKVVVIINGVGTDKKPRKFARKGKDAFDPVRLLMHEIGHCLRLADTKNKKDIMSSGVEKDEKEKGNHDTKLSEEDIQEAKDAAKGDLKVASLPAVGDVVPVATDLPTAPVVKAYMFMAADAHDRYRDLDAAEEWLERAMELDPYNTTAKKMLAQVKEEKQQAGLKRMGVALTVLQKMMEELEEQEQQEGEGEGSEEELVSEEEELPEGEPPPEGGD